MAAKAATAPAPSATTRSYRTTCKIGACEPFCGIEVDVVDGRMSQVRPDPAHPLTQGYACLKGMRVADYQNDPDRLTHPQKRGKDGWEEVSWDEATADIGRRLAELRDRYGPRSIATYWGNASDSAAITLANSFCHSFGSPNSFNVLSLEYTDRGAVAERMLGNENYILQPDAEQSSFALLLGTNPLVTQGMTLLQRRAHMARCLKGIQARNGKVVVVDPRRTETAMIASEHIAIRPGTYLFLLMAMLRMIIDAGAYDARFVASYASGFDRLSAAVATVDLAAAAELCGLRLPDIEKLAQEFAEADSAFATTRVGVQTSRNTTLTEWAVQALNAITGNVDRRGGVYFNPGVVDVPALIKRFSKRRNPAASRIGGYPQIFGGPPAPVFADDVLSDDPDRIRALIVVAGNPVITFPDTARVEQALRRLDLLVCIDLYRSDTGAFAHYNLPAKTAFEKSSFHFLTSTFEPYPHAEWKAQIVESAPQVRSEWDIFKGLAKAAKVPFLNDPLLDRVMRIYEACGGNFKEDVLYRFVLLGKSSPRRLARKPGGLKFGDIEWGKFVASGLATADKRINLAPQDFVEELHRCLESPPGPTSEFPMLLISGARRAAGYNSWTHNIPALMEKMKGNWAELSPADARRLGLELPARVRLSTDVGSVEVEARASDDIREGVVSLHQFWGHNYDSSTRTSRSHPGVNVNFLHGSKDLDTFTGMPVYNARPCRIEAAD